MMRFATHPDRTRALPAADRSASTTGGDVRLFLTAYTAGFVFLFVLLG